MKILKIKLQIFLVGFIIYQGGLIMHKKEQGYDIPGLQPATMQAQGGFISPAYASDNGGIDLNIPYDPYSGSATSNHAQMQAAAQAEVQRIMHSGDTAQYQDFIDNDPFAKEIFGLK